MAGLPYRPSCGPALGLSSRVGPRSFCDLDHQDVRTNFGLTEVHAGVAPARLQGMLSRLHSWNQTVPGAIPTTDPYDRSFDPIRYWRGPVWVLVNWLVADGLIRSGENQRAEVLRSETRLLVERGSTGYYDPPATPTASAATASRGAQLSGWAWLPNYQHTPFIPILEGSQFRFSFGSARIAEPALCVPARITRLRDAPRSPGVARFWGYDARSQEGHNTPATEPDTFASNRATGLVPMFGTRTPRKISRSEAVELVAPRHARST